MNCDCGCDCSEATCMPDVKISADTDSPAGACLLIPGEGPRRVSATVKACDARAGLRFEAAAGTHKGIQVLVDTETGRVELGDEVGSKTWVDLPEGDVRIAAYVEGTKVTATVNGECLGVGHAKKPDALSAYVVCTGTGGASFESICVEPIK